MRMLQRPRTVFTAHFGLDRSGLTNPYAPRQGFVKTYGCLRMQNADGEELSRLIIDHGNSVPLVVQSPEYPGPSGYGCSQGGGGGHNAYELLE